MSAALLVPGTLRATDADGDGIPATWEAAYAAAPYNLNLSDSNPADASLDPDGDFLTNLGEFQSGTDPSDADSYNDGVLDVYSQRPPAKPVA